MLFFVLAGLLLLSLASCLAPAAKDEAKASLVLSFGSAARAFAPTTATVARYWLSATGPGGQTCDSESEETSLTLELAPGEWSIAVEGRAVDGRKLVSGSILVRLGAGERQNAVIILLPEGGTGSLSLSWSSQGDPGAGFGIEGALKSPNEEDIGLSATGIAGSLVLAEVPAGSWSLGLRLLDAGGSIAGLADSILIVSGCETKVIVVFEPPAARLALSLVGPRFSSETATIKPALRRVPVGASARFQLASETGPGSWYQNGELLPETGPELSILAQTEKKERVDWVSTASFSACSGKAEILARAPLSSGPFAWRETLQRTDLASDPAAKSLDGCRDLAFSPDGKGLFLAAKDGLALGKLLLGEPPSPTLAGAITKAEQAELDAPVRLGIAGDRLLLLAEGSGCLLSYALGPDGLPGLRGLASSPDLLSGRALVLSGDGNFAYVASESGDSIIRVALAADGSPGLASIAARGLDSGLEALDRPLSLALSPDNSILALGTAGDDAVYLFNREAASGNLALAERIAKEAFLPLASLSDPVDLAFTPDGKSLFVLSYYGKCLIRLDRDGLGSFKPVAAAKSGTSGIAGFDYPKRLAINPTGSLLALSGGGLNDGLAVFAIASPAQLSYLASLLPDGSDRSLGKPSPLAFSPDGRYLAVASPDEDRLALYSVSP